MKRFALLIAVVLTSMLAPNREASAAPGDAELNAWYLRWMDADFRLQLRYNPRVFNSYLIEDHQAQHELYVIYQTFPGTAAATEARNLHRLWTLTVVRGIGIRDTSYFP